MKTISLKCDTKVEEYSYYVVEALIFSVFIYMLSGFLLFDLSLKSPSSIGIIFLLSLLVGIIWAEVINHDLISKILGSSISSQDKIFYNKALDKFKEKWHVIGFKNGKEVVGIIREYNTGNNEMLIEKASWVINGNKLSEEMWLYLPPNQDIEYIRSIE